MRVLGLVAGVVFVGAVLLLHTLRPTLDANRKSGWSEIRPFGR
jgi:hypothetical protein